MTYLELGDHEFEFYDLILTCQYFVNNLGYIRTQELKEYIIHLMIECIYTNCLHAYEKNITCMWWQIEWLMHK